MDIGILHHVAFGILMLTFPLFVNWTNMLINHKVIGLEGGSEGLSIGGFICIMIAQLLSFVANHDALRGAHVWKEHPARRLVHPLTIASFVTFCLILLGSIFLWSENGMFMVTSIQLFLLGFYFLVVICLLMPGGDYVAGFLAGNNLWASLLLALEGAPSYSGLEVAGSIILFISMLLIIAIVGYKHHFHHHAETSAGELPLLKA